MRASLVVAILVGSLSGCVSMVAEYDPTFDVALNGFSEQTAVLLASAAAGQPARRAGSPQATAYYAAGYNMLDRMSARAARARGGVACPTNGNLASFAGSATSRTTLPPDFMQFDCREFQLYAVRLNLDQLAFAHDSGGELNGSEARAVGGILQASIIGAIETFSANRPSG